MQKGFAPILIVLVIALGIGGYFIYQNRTNSLPSLQGSILTYEECLQSKNHKIVKTFPRQCVSDDGKNYIEKVTEPIDTSAWTTFNLVPGFSFKCPPSWSCTAPPEFEKTALISVMHYVGININLILITSDNFHESLLRHPNYKTPVAWLKDVEAKKDISIKVFPETIKQGRAGTDEQLGPRYYSFKFDKMSELQTKTAKALVFLGVEGDTDDIAMIPLNQADVLYVSMGPRNISQNPIVKAILTSIEPN